MSRGFYSKHYVSPDRCFYYNPETGLSTWSPPVDGLVLEAPNARKNLIVSPEDSTGSDIGPAAAPTEALRTPKPAETATEEPLEDATMAGPAEGVAAEVTKASAGQSTVDEFLSSAWEQVSKKKSG